MTERLLNDTIKLYSADILLYVQSFSLSREEAKEIVSDVFLELWQNRDKTGEILRLKAWLMKVAHNKTISCLRKRENQIRTIPWDEAEDFVMSVDLQTPDEHIISREELDRINRIIKSLPPRCQQVFVLAKIEKLPYREIADVLGISVKTINVHIAKALEVISVNLCNL